MAEDIKQRLRLIVSVALAMVPRHVRRQYADRLTLTADAGKETIADAVTDGGLTSFDVTKKEPSYGPPLGSQAAGRGREPDQG